MLLRINKEKVEQQSDKTEKKNCAGQHDTIILLLASAANVSSLTRATSRLIVGSET